MEIKSTVMAPMWPDVSAQFHQELITALRATTAPNKHVMFSLVSGADTDSQHIADSVWNDLTLLPED